MKKLLFGTAIAMTAYANADVIMFTDGRVLRDAYIRDEGVRFAVWENLAQVSGAPKYYRRDEVKSFEIQRGAAWDAHPNLPDLSVVFIEVNPKLAGLHGKVNYDSLGRPTLGNSPLIPDLGERIFMNPEEAAKNLKLSYKSGEVLTLTANVRNVGFAEAAPFSYEWKIDGAVVAKGRYASRLKEMQFAKFEHKWAYQPGAHHVSFTLTPTTPEISVNNNSITDPLWGMGLVYIVHNGRVAAWHKNRTGFGTFSFEDWYRWHIELMNLIFENSIWPSAPYGIRARVRLDRIVYVDGGVEKAAQGLFQSDGIRYDQGNWTWIDDDDKKGNWKEPEKQWRNSTEWSLPHELGHQLGLTDLYGLDYPGDENHVMADNGDKIGHFMTYPNQMMHWHGPHLYGELDAGYLNKTWDKPRGYFGDFYFQLPKDVYLRIVDVNGEPVASAEVELFQRGAEVDASKNMHDAGGVMWADVIEDGNYDKPVSKLAVIKGTTNADGIMHLPNRPVAPVATLNGYERKPNPFGNINVVGNRGLLLVKVKAPDSEPVYFWIEIFTLNVAYLRGHEDKYTITFNTPFRSDDSPKPPTNVRIEKVDERHAKLRWAAPDTSLEPNYLSKFVGFRVYRRQTSDGLETRPWVPLATVGPQTREFIVDLQAFPEDHYWNSKVNRFAVSSIGFNGKQSELVQMLEPK